MSDLLDEENRNLLENYSFDINQSLKDPFNYQPENINITVKDDKHYFKEKSKSSSQVEELNNMSDNNNILNEGRSSISSINNSDNNQYNSNGTHEMLDNFRCESDGINEDFQSIPQKYSDNHQNVGYVNLEENKKGVIQKGYKTKSEKNKKNKKESIFFTKKIPKTQIKYKLSNYKIRWRTAVTQFYMARINKLIEESDLLKKYKLNTPNYEEFTEKANIKKTTSELKEKMKDILEKKKIKKRKNPNQEQEGNNSKNIKELEGFYEKNKNSSSPIKNLKEILELLNDTYAKIIKKFYDSKEIEIFKNKDDIKFYDEKYMDNGSRKSLFEKYELIDLLKKKKFRTKKSLIRNKRKRDK